MRMKMRMNRLRRWMMMRRRMKKMNKKSEGSSVYNMALW
jgi:hypothetical protein